jgi:pimeloyl-ACP methyl ester carboxylesterase
LTFLFVALLAVAALLLTGFLYQTIETWLDASRYPPPGRLVDAVGSRLHLTESGTAGPPVVFEAGIAASSLSWRLVEPEVARFARAYSHDRAGLGWSDGASEPRTLRGSVDQLRAVLDVAQVPKPRILVGHSYGALIVRAYAAWWPDEVAGVLLVDPVAISDWAEPSETRSRMLRHAIRLSRRGALLARFGIVRASLALVLAGSRRLPKLIARVSSGQGQSIISRMTEEVGKLPRAVWPAVQSHWSLPRCFESMAQHLASLPECAAEAARLDISHLPLTILSGAKNSTPAELAEREALRGRHIIVENSGHWIQLDRPDAVVKAIREMVLSVD